MPERRPRLLAALADRPAAGFEVLERANAAAEGTPILGPGTLYRLMRELRGAGLIRRTEAPASGTDEGVQDDRRTYHELTGAGRVVLEAEAARLRRLLGIAGLADG